VSITAVREVVCRCGAPVRVFIATSVNAERHPHMRDAILRRAFHVFECGACHQPLGVEKEFLYIDLTRGEFYGVFPLAAAADPDPCARQIAAAFETALGADASAAARQLGEGMRVRVCFGTEELREKIVARAAGLSDLALELLKADVLRENPALAELGIQTLRLEAVGQDGGLGMWLEQAGTPPRLLQDRAFTIERAVYDVFGAMSWQDLLARLPGVASGPHVSLLRLLR
jgi:CpXC protein